ncbi:MAG: toxic anion resistance protein [Eubacteriaceae bacterium]|jgi:uncharacterized protein YaaN involved in tellurite resistance
MSDDLTTQNSPIELSFDSTPSLTLEHGTKEEQMPALVNPADATPETLQLQELTPAEQKMVSDFAKQIDVSDSALVMQYGAGSQKKIADFSDTALANVKSKDLGEVGDMLSSMVTELKNFEKDDDSKGGFMGLFKKQKNKIDTMKNRYSTAEKNMDGIIDSLEGYQVTLMKDIAMLDKLYDVNKDYFKELSMYILAGKQKLDQARTVELPALVKKSETTKLPEDTQAANDYSQMIDRFDKKIHDLELTRIIALQMAPQIRQIQNNDTLMAEKIQSSLVNTIPLWKSQMALALGLAHSGQAAKAQREVTDMTNSLLKKNSEMLKTESINIAKESERGIVDIETLKQTNSDLISTFDEVMQIQSDGRQKRAEAEKEMAQIEAELKQKMLDLSRKQTNV